jgi:hypothetical protein
MKRTLLIAVAALTLVAALFWTAPLTFAQSQSTPLTDEQRSRIVENCTSIKNTLNQLKVSDALLRVNRGQTYESLRSRLMDTFNSRIGNNNLDAKGMVSITDSYNDTLNSFRVSYQAYERQLIAAIRIDCTQKPDEFHAAVENARGKRAEVHAQILKLHTQIDNYKTVVTDFYEDFKRVSRDQ